MLFVRRIHVGAIRFAIGFSALAASLFFLSGCGVEAYESKMQEHKKRLDYLIQEADKVAEYQLDWQSDPKKNKDDIEPAEFSYRPPKGIQPRPDEKGSRGGLWLFPGPPSGPIREMWVSVKKSDNPDSFAKGVRDQLKIASNEKKAFSAGPISTKVNYDRISEKKKPSNPSGNCDLFLLKKPGGTQVAVAFKWDETKEVGAVESALNLSLGTLRVGLDAANPPRPYIPPSAAKKKAPGGK